MGQNATMVPTAAEAYPRYLEALLAGDRRRCHEVFEAWLTASTDLRVPTFRPDLVLSDWDMPELDGLEMCRRIKSDPASADVFVILISGTYTQSEEQSAGMESGADSYIARPIANRELSARVGAFVRILRLNRARRDKNAELEEALAKVKLLSGLVPICAGCKKIRDDQGFWSQVEFYIQEHSEATFTHGMCPDCIKKYYPGIEIPELAEPRKPN